VHPGRLGFLRAQRGVQEGQGTDFRDFADGVASHEKFKKKSRLRSTVERSRSKGVQTVDVIQEKSMYGRKYMGVERSTFLIDAKGCCGTSGAK